MWIRSVSSCTLVLRAAPWRSRARNACPAPFSRNFANAVQQHPVVRVNAETGRKALFVNAQYTIGLDGFAPHESKPILDFLFAQLQPDKDTVDTELCLKDLETVEKRRDKTQRSTKAPGKEGELARVELAVLDKLKAKLDEAIPVRAHGLSDDELEVVRELFLLTSKPVLYIANVAEAQLAKADSDPYVKQVMDIAAKEKAEVVVLAAAKTQQDQFHYLFHLRTAPIGSWTMAPAQPSSPRCWWSARARRES